MVQGVQGLVSGCYPQCASSTDLSSVSSIGLGKQHVHAEEHLETLLMSFDSYIDSDSDADSTSPYSSSTSITKTFPYCSNGLFCLLCVHDEKKTMIDRMHKCVQILLVNSSIIPTVPSLHPASTGNTTGINMLMDT